MRDRAVNRAEQRPSPLHRYPALEETHSGRYPLLSSQVLTRRYASRPCLDWFRLPGWVVPIGHCLLLSAVIRIVIACRGEVFYSMAEFFLREPMSFLNLLPISLSLFSFSPLCGRRVL